MRYGMDQGDELRGWIEVLALGPRIDRTGRIHGVDLKARRDNHSGLESVSKK